MSPEETLYLLKLVVAGDRRTVGPEDVAYWHAMLAPIPLAKAVDALVLIQRREPDTWIKPGHIWQLCSTKTDGETVDDGQYCEHGTFCSRCKLVHWPEEPCTVLEARELPRPTLRMLPAGPSADPDSPEVDPEQAQAVEAERARQLAALTPLVAAAPADTEAGP